MRFFEELKRRNVFRVAAAYVLLGWLVIQVTDTVSPALNLPEWTLGLVTWLGIIGFPFAIFFAWAFELTPEGIRRESEVERSESTAGETGWKLDIALIVLLVATIGFIAWNSHSGAPEAGTAAGDSAAGPDRGSAATASDLSIAVLPLINMSADTDNAFFAGGVHEEILTNLASIENLRVISRTTALRYINSDKSLRDIGHELDVRYIVEGSVRRVNNHVRITVQLIDAGEDAHVWASNYDRELTDVFAVQSSVAREISNSLHLEIQPETVGALDNMPTRSVKAYDLYMKALSIDRSEVESEDALLRQRQLLEASVAEDPDFVEAWGFLNEILDHIARNILQNNWFGDTGAERDAAFTEVRQAAERALTKAVALDPDNIETLLALASDFVSEQQVPGFQAERKVFIDRAIELDPDNAVAWLVLGWWHRMEGDVASATPAFKKSLELDPLHARIVSSALTHFRLAADQDMTTRLFERLTQIAPEKADDKFLAEVPPPARMNNLLAMFVQTADEAVIDVYAEELALLKASDRSDLPISELEVETNLYFWTFELAQMRGDTDLALSLEPVELPADASETAVMNYLWQNVLRLQLQQAEGLDDAALKTARTMHDVYPERFDSGSRLVAQAVYPMTSAHIALGDADALDELRQAILENDEEPFSRSMNNVSFAFSLIDTEASVRRILETKAEHPTSVMTDYVAVGHIVYRHLLVHPEMQAFFAREGKWIDYLAERVPEYAKYRR